MTKRQSLTLGLQLQRGGVHTIAQSCRTRSIRKDMTEMSVTTAAQYFNAAHAVFVVFFCCDAVLLYRLIETGPPAAGFILRIGAEQLLAAAHARVSPGPLLRVVLSCKWRLGSTLARHSELVVGQLRPPIGVALTNLFRHENPNQIRCATTRFDSSPSRLRGSTSVLKGMAEAQNSALFEMTPENLHSNGQTVGRLAARHRNAWDSRK